MFVRSRVLLFFFCLLAACTPVLAQDFQMPGKPNPPRLVNDYAHVLNAQQLAQLEAKLVEFDRTTSTQITIVTVPNLGGRDVSDYSLELFNHWGIGQGTKNNGVLLLAAIQDRKAWITVGKGLEGVLTDAKSGHIFRNEIVPAFRDGRYYDGLANASDAIIAVTKGEYSADDTHKPHKKKGISGTAIIILIIVIIYILKMFRGGGGGRGGGDYMSGRGMGNLATGWLLGSLLSGGSRGGGWGGGSSGGWGGGGGGFGGFGGGSSGGGGAGGSW
jgi:uncharacterized protein